MNAIPIGGYALQMIAMVVFAWLSSRTGWRATWIWIQMVRRLDQDDLGCRLSEVGADPQGITAIGLIILTIWPPSFGVKMVGYFLLWTSNAAGPILIVSSPSVSLYRGLTRRHGWRTGVRRLKNAQSSSASP